MLWDNMVAYLYSREIGCVLKFLFFFSILIRDQNKQHLPLGQAYIYKYISTIMEEVVFPFFQIYFLYVTKSIKCV